MTIPTKSLVHFDAFPFVDETGGTVTDYTGGTQASEQSSTAKFGSGSLICGSGQRIGVANTITTGDFTFEAWYYNNASTGNFQFLGSFGTEGTDRRAWGIYNGNICIDNYGIGIFVNFGAPPSLNVWNHIALVRSGTNLMCFVNGTQLGSTYAFGSGTFGNTGNLIVGSDSNGISPFLGFIDEWRVSNTARYTSNFTPSTTAFTLESTGNTATIAATAPKPVVAATAYAVVAANVSANAPRPTASITAAHLSPAWAHFHMDGNFTNSGTNGVWTPTAYAAYSGASPTITSTDYKFGGGSGYFNGSYLLLNGTTGTNIGESGFGDWTVETWVRVTDFSTYPHLFSFDTAANNRFNIYIDKTNGQVNVYSEVSGTAYTTLHSSAGAVSLNTWAHIALTRSGSTLQLFVNGTSVGSTSSYALPAGNLTLHIGGSVINGNPDYLIGDLDEFRITKRVIYTTNFTPNTSAWAGGEALGEWSVNPAGSIAAVAPLPTFSVASQYGPAVSIATTAPRPTASVTSRIAAVGAVTVTAPMPTASFSGFADTIATKSLLHFDSTTTTETVPGTSVTVVGTGTPTIDNTTTKYGTGAYKSPVTGNAGLKVAFGSNWTNPTTSSFTVEGWFYRTSGTLALFSFGNESTGRLAFVIDSTNNLYIDSFSASSPKTWASAGGTLNAWHHYAFVRTANTITYYLDGVAQGTPLAYTDGTVFGNSNAFYVGCAGPDTGLQAPLQGYMDEIRVSNTARYTGNFTPAGPFILDNQSYTAAISATAPMPNAAFTVPFIVKGSIAVTAPAPTASVSGSIVDYLASITVTAPKPTAAINAAQGIAGSLSVTAPRPTAGIFANIVPSATISATAPMPTAAIAIGNTPGASIAATAPAPSATIVAQQFSIIDQYLYHFEGTLNSDYTAQWNTASGALSTAYSKFGTGSFDSNSGFLRMPGTLSGDFTMEGWFRFDPAKATAVTGSGLSQFLFSFGDSTTVGHGLGVTTDGGFYWYDYQTASATFGTVASFVTDGLFHHVAFVRQSGNVACFVDGIQLGSPASLPGDLSYGTNSIYLGGIFGNSSLQRFTGWSDEVRIASAAYYTHNFVPPSAPFPTQGNSTYTWAAIQPIAPRPFASVSGNHTYNAVSVSVTTPMPTAAFSSNHAQYAGLLSVTAPRPTASLSAGHGVTASIGATAPKPTSLFNGTAPIFVSIGATAPKPNVSMPTFFGPSVQVSAVAPAPHAFVDAREGAKASIVVTTPQPSAYLQGFASQQITVFNGAQGEIVVLNKAVSDDDRLKVEGYMAWKWHRQDLLADNHPYRWTPPLKNYTAPRYIAANAVAPMPTANVQAMRLDAMIAYAPRPYAVANMSTNPALLVAATTRQPVAMFAGGTNPSATVSVTAPRPAVLAYAGTNPAMSAAATTIMPTASVASHFGYYVGVGAVAPMPSAHVQVGDPYWQNIALLLQGDNQAHSVTYDSSPRQKSIQGGIMSFDNTTSPYAGVFNRGYAIKFNPFGNGSPSEFGYFYETADPTYPNDYNFGTGDFTFELWLKKGGPNFGGTKRLLDQRVTGAGKFYIDVSETTGLMTNGALSGTTSINIMDGSWHHIAYSRVNGILMSFVDGQLQQTGTWANAYDMVDSANGGFLVIGGNFQNYIAGTTDQPSANTNNWTGWMDDIRITKGVGRYSANFTPPIQPFSAL